MTRRLSGVLQTGCDAVDGEEQQLLEALALRVVVRSPAQRAQRTQLQMTESVDVGVAMLEQPRLTGDREDLLDGTVVLVEDELGDARLIAKLQILGGHESIRLGKT